MPANLTQQYLKAEAEYRRATSLEDELRLLQLMLRELPKHKGTDKLQADLKQKISRVKRESESASEKRTRLRIPRQGAGRVVLIGGPNAGKSQLIRSMTRAEPEVAPYPFTTREATPAMMPFDDVMVQLIDTPPIAHDLFDAHVQALIRGADLVLWLIDIGTDDGIDAARELQEKLNTTKTRLANESYLDETDVGRTYTKTVVVLNKIDDAEADDRYKMLKEFCEYDFREYRTSATTGEGIEELRETIYRALDVVRVYTKQPSNREADMEKPFTVRRGETLINVAELIHKDLVENFKSARIWGSEVHPGTIVKGDYVVHDKDIVEIHT